MKYLDAKIKMSQNVGNRTGLASIIAPNSAHISANSLSKKPEDQEEEIEEAKEVWLSEQILIAFN